jgi:Flp pilus assembly pilin Flp
MRGHAFSLVPLFLGEHLMTNFMELSKRFFSDEKAAEVTELGIVLALIVAGCVAVIALIGPKIKAAYDLTNTSLDPPAA